MVMLMFKRYSSLIKLVSIVMIITLFVTVSPILASESTKISVMGEVKTPGSYELISNQNIFDAVAKAGGFSNIANRKKIKLLRRGIGSRKKAVVIDFSKDVLAMHAGEVKNFDDQL